MNVQFKKTSTSAIIPTYGSPSAAGLDLCANIPTPIELAEGQPSYLIGTGIAMHLSNPETVAMIFPRSGLGHKRGLVLGNGTGVIDADYQGELFISVCVRVGHGSIVINPGDKIAQLVIMPIIRAQLVEVEHFGDTSVRGEGGFGSTGI